MNILFSLLAFFLAIFLETAIPLPFVLFLLLFLGIFLKEEWVFIFALLGGLILDSLFFAQIGERSIFFIVMLGILFAYQRKFIITSLPFALSISVIAAALYEAFFSFQNLFFCMAVTIPAACILFFIITFIQNRQPSRNIL